MEYPQHEAKTWYEELLSHDGLDVNNMRHKVKDYSLSGAYRCVILYDFFAITRFPSAVHVIYTY